MKRSSIVVLLCAGGLLLATALFLLYPGKNLPDAPLRAMPSEIYGFVRVRVARVLSSKPWREIVVDRKEDRGIQRVTSMCGFNPLESLNEIVVYALPGTQKTQVAVNARGSLTRSQLIDCAGKFPGGDMASFVYERVAGFDTVRSKKGSERAAFIGRDGFIAGREEGVGATLATLAGEHPSAENDALLAELFGALSRDGDLGLALRVPENPALRAALAEQAGFSDSPFLAELRALTLDAHLVDDRIVLDVQLWLRDATRSRAMAEQLGDIRAQILALPGLGLIGLATPVRELRIAQEGDRVKVHADLQARTVNAAIDLLPTLVMIQKGMTLTAPPTDADAAVPQADAGAQTVDAGSR